MKLIKKLQGLGEKSLADKMLKVIAQTQASDVKKRRYENGTIKSWWQMQDSLKEKGLVTEDQAVAFFCPVYFAGQAVVRALLDVVDEQGELVMFGLPSITDPERIKVGIGQMKLLGINDPEQYLTHNGKSLPIYSSLPGVEGVGSSVYPEYIAREGVQLGAFMIVPKQWLNIGDPYNQTYAFPGEKGYSPFWRIPEFEEFSKIRPDMVDAWKESDNGYVLKKYN